MRYPLFCYLLLLGIISPRLLQAQYTPPPRDSAEVFGRPQPVLKQYPHRPYDRMQAVKVAFWGPLWGTYAVSYERMLDVNLGLDFQAAYIDHQPNPDSWESPVSNTGGYAAVGVKYILAPDKLQSIHNSKHTLDGLFVMPQLAFSTIRRTEEVYVYPCNGSPGQGGYSGTLETRHYYAALLFGAGYQIVLRNRLLLQTYGAFGYGLHDRQVTHIPVVDIAGGCSWEDTGERGNNYAYSHVALGRAAIRLTFNLGWCF
ncbi:MAG: hypothetical protein KF690_09805 [Bacteroidetes bacterium]|nr:hypothetical protein [Bacteroidota bacterium]